MRELITRNLHLKVISFTLTLTLYSFVLAENRTERTFALEPEIVDLPANHVVLNELGDVSVTLAGSRRGFARIDPDALRTLPIAIDQADVTRWEIRAADLRIPAHLDVVSIDPPWIAIDMDQLVTRVLPVRENLRGSPARGFEISGVTVEPGEIAVTAPSSYFPELSAAFTQTIDLAGSSGTIREQVGLSFQRPYVNYPDTPVSVTIQIDAEVEERLLDDVPLRVVNGEGRCTSEQTSVRLSLVGPKTVIDALNPEIVFATVDCAEYLARGPGQHLTGLSVKNLERSVEVAEALPNEILLTVEAPVRARPVPPLEGSGVNAPDTEPLPENETP